MSDAVVSAPATGNKDGATSSVGSSNPLTRKLQRILGSSGAGTGTDARGPLSEDVLDALDGLDAIFEDNSLKARRNLRGDLERHGLAINEQFIDAFKDVQARLKLIQSDISTMSTCCVDMTGRLSAARAQTSDLIKRTTGLKQQSQTAELQKEVLAMFLERYQLSDDEHAALESEELDQRFFAAVEKVRLIHERCKVLLRTREQNAGLSIMEAMASLQESSYERLYRWTQSTCRSLTQPSAEHPSILIPALRALRNRSVLYQFCITELAQARHSAVVRGFIDALTRGGPGGLPKPIELHSHDPVRYCSDMLAWLHQCVASEKEQLLVLLAKSSTDAEITGRPRISQLPEADKEMLHTALNKALEGACRPLQARIEQVLMGQPKVVVCYQLANLLQFYGATIQELVEFLPSLVAVLSELHALALKMFFDRLNIHANQLLVDVEPPPDDLAAPSEVEKALDLLREVLSCQDIYADKTAKHEEDMGRILQCILDPLLEMCTISASSLSPSKGAVYLGNCIYQVETMLAVYDHTEERVKMLGSRVAEHLNMLVEDQAQNVLKRSGLSQVMLQMQSWEAEPDESRGPMSTVEGLDPSAVKAAVSRLDAYLAAANFGLAFPCEMLLSTQMRASVSQRSVKFVAGLYGRFYASVFAPANMYAEPNALLPRTPQQVSALMG